MVAMNSLWRKVRRLEELHYLRSEADLRRELSQKFAIEQAKRRLADAAGTDNRELIDMLFDAGFTAESLPALSVAPIALVAWGSGCVTSEERAVALKAVQDSDIAGNVQATAKFRSWLDERPDPNLLYLWANITKDRMKMLRRATQQACADRTLRLANDVARASGGILGFGSICAGEQTWINRFRVVLQQDSI